MLGLWRNHLQIHHGLLFKVTKNPHPWPFASEGFFSVERLWATRNQGQYDCWGHGTTRAAGDMGGFGCLVWCTLGGFWWGKSGWNELFFFVCCHSEASGIPTKKTHDSLVHQKIIFQMWRSQTQERNTWRENFRILDEEGWDMTQFFLWN